jgi:hypothetical protein
MKTRTTEPQKFRTSESRKQRNREHQNVRTTEKKRRIEKKAGSMKTYVL